MWTLLKRTVNDWVDDRAQTEGAALAFYASFSLAPLLMIIVAVLGMIFGHQALQGNLVASIGDFVGEGPAQSIQELLKTAATANTKLATLIGAVGALAGASAGFIQLQSSLNMIWGVAPRPGRGVLGIMRTRFFSFLMVAGAGLVMLALLIASIVISTLNGYVKGSFLGNEMLWYLVNVFVSFSLFTLIFAMIFKYVPEVKIQWRNVWLGAVLTSALFTIGKILIGLYLGKTGVTTAYGAAGSLALLLLWTYYSAQIFFFGAEFTQVYARQHGSPIEPGANAIPLTEARAGDSRWRTGRATTERTGSSGIGVPPMQSRPDSARDKA